MKQMVAVVALVFVVHLPSMTAQSLTITNYAGLPVGGAEDGRGSAVRFYLPAGVATDQSGNI